MESASTKIFKQLKDSGYRLTDARKEIVHSLLKAHEPLTIQMIAERVSVDEASVYRTIAVFKKLAIIEEILEPGAVRRYAIAHGHHHHIVCTNCSFVVHTPCGDIQQQRIKHPDFVDIVTHDVTYYGYCHRCA